MFRIRSITALLLIFLGVILILENLGIKPLGTDSIWSIILPIIILFIGLQMIFDDVKRGYGGWMFGAFLVIFGSLLLLNYFDVIDFSFKDIFKLWPLFIVYAGLSIIRTPKRRKRSRITYSGNTKGQKHHWKNYSIGDHEFKDPNWKVEPMELSGLAGEYYLDFTKAFIPEEEIPISIHSLAGDVRILVPESVEFRAEATVKAGEIDIVGNSGDGINRYVFYETPGYSAATQKLDLFIDVKAGSVRIDSV